MDSNSTIGIILVVLAILIAVVMGGTAVDYYINVQAIFIVLGGTFGSVMMAYRPRTFFSALKNAALIFRKPKLSLADTIDTCVALSNLVRKDGIIAADNMEFDEPFMRKATNMMLDGHDKESIDQALTKEMVLSIERNNMSIKVMNSFAEIAPAMGMVGTLIGLVAMLVDLSNPETLGPSMAVALITTLYGAIIAFGFASPIATKLDQHNKEVFQYQSLVKDATLQILDGQNPKLTFEFLQSYIASELRRPEEAVSSIIKQ